MNMARTNKALGAMVVGALLLWGAAGSPAVAATKGEDGNADARSGYSFAEPETRTIQDDDFENPAFTWVQQAVDAWKIPDGELGRSCQTCHGDADASMTGVGARYPVWDASRGKPINVEQRINQCRVNNMRAPEWKWESDQLLGMTAYVKMFSRGMPMEVAVDGPMAEWLEKGKEFYHQRRGMYDMACKHCHDDHVDNYIRAERLSQGQINGFPTYRLKWQKLGSLHRRFRGCNKNIRSEPYAYGADEYLALEIYLSWRGRGLPIESPSVRR